MSLILMRNKWLELSERGFSREWERSWRNRRRFKWVRAAGYKRQRTFERWNPSWMSPVGQSELPRSVWEVLLAASTGCIFETPLRSCTG